jgi:hypothetical protein
VDLVTQGLVDLRGTARARGFEHGRLLRDRIQESVRRWQDSLVREYGVEADTVIRRFLDATDFAPAMERWTPGILDEVHGMAEGAELDIRLAYSFQLLDEMWNHAEDAIGGQCTSLGYAGNARSTSWIAQNIDVEAFRDGHQAVLHIQDTDHGVESYVVSSAGVLGFNGLNCFGVGICCNGMMQVPSSSVGLPVACVVRGALLRKTAADAAAFIREVPHASGQNYLVGGPDGVICLECSATEVARFQPEERPNAVWHTNHPLALQDLQPWYRDTLVSGQLHPFVVNSRARLASAREQMLALAEPSVDALASILRSKGDAVHPICGSGGPGALYTDFQMMTLASTIMELTASPRLHVALGPPDRAAFRTLTF